MDWVVRVRHCTSGSLVISDLVVREMCVAHLDKIVATRGRRWGGEGGRMELKEGWDIVVQVFLLLSNLTQGSGMSIMSVVWCVRWRRVCITFVDFAVLCWIKRIVWWVLCDGGCAHIKLRFGCGGWSLCWGWLCCLWMLC